MITLASLLPYGLVALGYLVRHFNLLGGLTHLLVAHAGASTPNRSPGVPDAVTAGLPVLRDAVHAAIKQTLSDAMTGHLQSIKAEIQTAVSAAVHAAVNDLKPKP